MPLFTPPRHRIFRGGFGGGIVTSSSGMQSHFVTLEEKPTELSLKFEPYDLPLAGNTDDTPTVDTIFIITTDPWF